MKAILLLTTELEPARAMLAEWRSREPAARWTVLVRDEHRAPLHEELAGCDVRRDKPAGPALAFVRALRAERFDLLVVAWHGGERPQPLRLVAPLLGARRAVALDERGRSIDLRPWRPFGALRHGVRRLAAIKALRGAQLLCAAYRSTVGWLLGGLWLTGSFLCAVLRRRPRRPVTGAEAMGGAVARERPPG